MDELGLLLNKIVEAKRGIDAIFVSELKKGFLLDSSKTENGRHPDLVRKLGGQAGAGGNAMTHMSVLQALERRISDFGEETGLGGLELTILQLGEKGDIKGTVVAYISHYKGVPMVIGFVNANPQDDSLGNIVFYCEQHIKDVRELVDKKYG